MKAVVIMDKPEEIIKSIKSEMQKGHFEKILFNWDWEIFAEHLAFVNRFGFSDIKNDVCNFIDSILSKPNYVFTVPKGSIVYRARIMKFNQIKMNNDGTFSGFNENESGMPSYRQSSNGRANTAGIPVLYTATESETACAELRPMKNVYISVAEYEMTDNVTVADFSLEQIEKNEQDIRMSFLREMFMSFSLPISNDLIDYLPSQFVAEYIKLKHNELAGIRYSSLHNEGGHNIAFFSSNNCRFLGSKVVECNKVIYEYEPLL